MNAKKYIYLALSFGDKIRFCSGISMDPLYIRAESSSQALILCNKKRTIAKILKGRDFAIVLPDGNLLTCYPLQRALWIRAEYCLGKTPVSVQCALGESLSYLEYSSLLEGTSH